ncbi:hypothetical protein IU444_28780 [Nocardia farcinica]|uniref:hypothetical protein n=1 Tax=Nocardia farcinica TaxID=37329 RepID=UPI0018931C96|nr:hypothetical protein [Nocardia farcinica]MBF6388126.1 hypothetical protein [Nocardia farcinica]UEX26376.1 hypothetical protein LMJ57_30980 [Nocardia farcinica]
MTYKPTYRALCLRRPGTSSDRGLVDASAVAIEGFAVSVVIDRRALTDGSDLELCEITSAASEALREAPPGIEAIEFALSRFRHDGLIEPVTLIVRPDRTRPFPAYIIEPPSTERTPRCRNRGRSRSVRRVACARATSSDIHIVMPRRRNHDGPKRHRRDPSTISDLFVRIDKTLVERAQEEAEANKVNLWEVVEDALRKGLPPTTATRRRPEQTLIDIPMGDRRAS